MNEKNRRPPEELMASIEAMLKQMDEEATPEEKAAIRADEIEAASKPPMHQARDKAIMALGIIMKASNLSPQERAAAVNKVFLLYSEEVQSECLGCVWRVWRRSRLPLDIVIQMYAEELHKIHLQTSVEVAEIIISIRTR